MPTEIRRFFEQYRDAVNLLDGRAVARLYAVPSGIAQDRKFTYWPEYEPIHNNNMTALCDLYRQRGYVTAEFEPTAFLQQGEDYAVADLSWKIIWSTGAQPWQFSTTYNLVRAEEGWRVLLCTAYSESTLHRQRAA